SIWLIVYQVTDSAHFLRVKTTDSPKDYDRFYNCEMVRHYGVPLSIISDRVPYIISKRVGKVAYELELPTKLAAIHLMFHISMHKKCISDPSVIVPT
ncbi:hypothetical protein MTR67_007463, partial [Solanum verrucosum]